MNKLSLQLTDKMLTNSNFKTGPKFWGLTISYNYSYITYLGVINAYISRRYIVVVTR
jgi:hypothetical protein